MRNIFLSFLVLLCFNTYAQVNNVFVSVKGNDNNPGTMQQPLKTIEKALLVSNTYIGKDVVIQLMAGTYYLDTTIVLNTANTLTTSLQIAAYKNDKVVISAGRRLQLHWQPYRDGIYKAIVPNGISFERLYVNGRLQVLARYPNYDSIAKIFHGTAENAIAPERVKRWKNPIGGYVHALHEYAWGGFEYRITGVDTNGHLQLEGGWQNNRPAGMHKVYRFVENIFEELDAPSEWYFDKAQHILYYYPPKEVDLSTATIEVSHLKNSIELRGTPGKPLMNVTLKNLTFAHNERTFMDTREPLLRSDWTIYRGAAVLFEGTENCTIANCDFMGLGGNAIMLSKYNKHDTISGCLIAGIGASAVCFIGDPNAVRSPVFKNGTFLRYDDLDKTPGPLTNNYPQECTVTDNLIHDIGAIEKQSTGVDIDMSSTITVTHNSIYNTPRAGINIGDGCWGGHILAHNDVFNTVLETGDHGAFNSWGRDRYWSGDRDYMDSIVRLHPELILLDAQKQTVIHDNRFRCDHGWDIDLDDGSTNYHIYNNVCLNGGLKLREGFYRVVENNILINNSFHAHVWFKNSGDAFEHNIVGAKYFPIGIHDWGTKIDYNLFTDTTATHAVQKNGTDKNSIAGNPLFVNAHTGDYAVAPNSPAYTIGFHNFSMNDFGVQSPRLKKLALQAPIPELITDIVAPGKSTVVSFLGGSIKSVDGLGERSAYGLPDETGVIIISAGNNTPLSKSGLRDKDVIVGADDEAIKDVKDLMAIYKGANWKGEVPVDVIRNQQHIKLKLQLKQE